MELERFKSNWDLFWTGIVCLSGIAILGYSEHGFTEMSFFGLTAALVTLGIIVHSTINTYLEIQDRRHLINKGFREFGYDKLDIYNIKAIYRGPAFAYPAWGSQIIILGTEGGNPTLKHTAVKERNYDADILKAFLERITELNPNIELDEEYQELLDGKRDLKKFKKQDAKKSMQEIKAMIDNQSA